MSNPFNMDTPETRDNANIMSNATNIAFQSFRKKPVVVQARQITEEMDIETLEGTMHGSIGDWLIIGVKGERYFCKPGIFALTYEPAALATVIDIPETYGPEAYYDNLTSMSLVINQSPAPTPTRADMERNDDIQHMLKQRRQG